MSAKGTFSFSFGNIIFMIIMYNLFFGDDDSDNQPTESVKEETPVIEEKQEVVVNVPEVKEAKEKFIKDIEPEEKDEPETDLLKSL